MMTYENALKKIHSLLSFGSRPGLDRMLALLDRMGNPQDRLKYIHVAGTNGKGSVCALLSSALVSAGYKTGLFISPYITDFCERIQINNTPVGREAIAEAVENTFPLIERLQNEGIIITEFEYVNALEFYIHANAECDIVVLETGMGGMLDCTNVIKSPLCSVITTIGIDHTAVLGSSLAEIAEQKCGIIKEHSYAVTSKQELEAMQVIESTARKLKIPLAKSEGVQIDIKSESLDGSVFDFNGTEILLPLAGEHQIENAETALAAIEILRLNGLIDISDMQIQDGFAKAKNPARLETLCKDPIVILDGAHNPNGAAALKRAIDRFLPNKVIICIMGMLADKDSESSLKLLENTFSRVFTVPIDNPRALTSEELMQKCRKHFDNVTAFDSDKSAFDAALEAAKRTGCAVVICGSLYLAGSIRPYVLSRC